MARTRIRHRRGPAHIWAEKNPILADGEIGIETDASKIKCGDGKRTWNALPYLRGTGTEGGADLELDWANIIGPIANNEALKTALDNKQSRSQKGKANGYAPLDAEGMIPAPHLMNVPIYLQTPFIVASVESETTFAASDTGLLIGDRIKINNKAMTVTAVDSVSVVVDRPVLSAADEGAKIGLAAGMIPLATAEVPGIQKLFEMPTIPGGHPVGGFTWHCGKTPPDGYLVCDGA